MTNIPKNFQVTDYSNYLLGFFLFINFSFCNIVSFREFSAVLDIIYALIQY